MAGQVRAGEGAASRSSLALCRAPSSTRSPACPSACAALVLLGASFGDCGVISALAIAVTRKPWGALIGVPYVLVPAVCLIWLRGHGDGFRLMMYLFFVVWGTDSGAYLVGRIVGGPKLAPQISPSKTWSGAIGGALIAAVTGLVVAMLQIQVFELQAEAHPWIWMLGPVAGALIITAVGLAGSRSLIDTPPMNVLRGL